jgi:hypothetical protein
MAQTSQDRPSPPRASYPPESTAWTGWVVFAGVMLLTLGSFQVIQGLVALFDNGFYLVRPSGLVVDVNYNTWGWTHLIIGVVMIVTGLGLFVGNMAARVLGVVAAVVSAIVNLAFISAYPVWSTIVIALDVVVIYAIIVHGRDLKDPYS